MNELIFEKPNLDNLPKTLFGDVIPICYKCGSLNPLFINKNWGNNKYICGKCFVKDFNKTLEITKINRKT